MFVKFSRVCCNCESHETYVGSSGYEQWHKHKCQKEVCTGYLCESCYNKYDPNSMNNILKPLRNIRTGNVDPNSTHAKGNRSQKLACVLYGWKDLNEENNNYSTGSPLDCYDPKTGLYHQVKGRYYNPKHGFWPFSGLDKDWEKKYESMVCFCYSEDGKVVERIYKILWIEIMRVKSISIFKNPMNVVGTSPIVPLYEKYRVGNKEELERSNEIWKDILNKK